MSHKTLHQELLKTLSYFSFFSYVPTVKEVWLFLPVKISFGAFKKALSIYLRKEKDIQKHGQYLYSGNKGGIDIGAIQESNMASNKKLRQLDDVYSSFHINPFICFVGVTGSVAANNANEEDDIDVFIISYPHRLWICRLITIVLLTLRGARRTPRSTDVKDKVCCNLWFDGADLQVPRERQTVFTAREIVLMKKR
jgi:hypothetical protein